MDLFRAPIRLSKSQHPNPTPDSNPKRKQRTRRNNRKKTSKPPKPEPRSPDTSHNQVILPQTPSPGSSKTPRSSKKRKSKRRKHHSVDNSTGTRKYSYKQAREQLMNRPQQSHRRGRKRKNRPGPEDDCVIPDSQELFLRSSSQPVIETDSEQSVPLAQSSPSIDSESQNTPKKRKVASSREINRQINFQPDPMPLEQPQNDSIEDSIDELALFNEFMNQVEQQQQQKLTFTKKQETLRVTPDSDQLEASTVNAHPSRVVMTTNKRVFAFSTRGTQSSPAVGYHTLGTNLNAYKHGLAGKLVKALKKHSRKMENIRTGSFNENEWDGPEDRFVATIEFENTNRGMFVTKCRIGSGPNKGNAVVLVFSETMRQQLGLEVGKTIVVHPPWYTVSSRNKDTSIAWRLGCPLSSEIDFDVLMVNVCWLK